jgi:hypothetical protein
MCHLFFLKEAKMKIISKAFKLFLSLSLILALVGCAGFGSSVRAEPEELLYFSWQCNQVFTPGPYSVSLIVYGSGDLTGTLGDVQLSGGGSPTAPAGQCQDIAKEAVDIAMGLECQTRGAVVGTNNAVFGAFCTGSRTKLIAVMGELLSHATTFVVPTP